MKVNFAAPKKLTITLILSGIFLLIFSGMALSEENETNEDPGYVEVFEVSGLLDDVLADALENAIHDAQRNGANGLILQVNSKQAVIPNARLIEIANQNQSANIPVDV